MNRKAYYASARRVTRSGQLIGDGGPCTLMGYPVFQKPKRKRCGRQVVWTFRKPTEAEKAEFAKAFEQEVMPRVLSYVGSFIR